MRAVSSVVFHKMDTEAQDDSQPSVGEEGTTWRSLKAQITGSPPPRVFNSPGWIMAQEFAFLASSQGMLMPLVWGPH